jgi:uncharacterized protein YbaR (Trm112 family)
MSETLSQLMALLRCPVTGQQLHLAKPEEVRALSRHDADGFLVREDGNIAYPVRGGIPALLPTDGIVISS